MSQKEIINRVFYYLTGSYASAVTVPWTVGSGTLSGTYFAIGWDAVDSNPGKIPFKYPISCIIDVPDDSGMWKEQEGSGYPEGTFNYYYKLRFWIIRRLQGNRNSLYGTTTEKGILEITQDILDVLTGTEEAMKLEISGSSYTDQLVYPINIDEGQGIDSTGELYARARRFDLTYRRLAVEY